ncbi:Holliday junction branch migration protein RuvA [Brooklawnia cerclae]|uniref:Holliday junction branch migration complex subunit RuvA n=1 Tax=Brooklawnia cerclae TaxID=349934 RepID=A0ABX0SER5_9ACTN|nr:Holliday junction branch migration protein RuvA [Brooklawnia cerclae]NIH56515.1 Holliday junction DNA helicase RuvA [Brooklawnia cerclae]
MIAQLTGKPAALGPNWVVLDVGGVGFRVQCTPVTAAGLRPSESATLATSLIVRQEALTLYGFASASERDVFELLQVASGVGPRIALAALSVLTPDQLARAIQAEDLAALTKVPGIGRKGAEKIVVELRDRVASLVTEPDDRPRVASLADEPWRAQVSAGLQGLGWSQRDAEQACDRVAALVDDDPDVSLATLMKAALQSLARV